MWDMASYEGRGRGKVCWVANSPRVAPPRGSPAAFGGCSCMIARSSNVCTYFAVFAAGTGASVPYWGAWPESFLNLSNTPMLVSGSFHFPFGRELVRIDAVSKRHGRERHF